jgi:hypothetical protein
MYSFLLQLVYLSRLFVLFPTQLLYDVLLQREQVWQVNLFALI